MQVVPDRQWAFVLFVPDQPRSRSLLACAARFGRLLCSNALAGVRGFQYL
jgi:hypothetical protein